MPTATASPTYTLNLDRDGYVGMLCAIDAALDRAATMGRECKDHPDAAVPGYWLAQIEKFNLLRRQIGRAAITES